MTESFGIILRLDWIASLLSILIQWDRQTLSARGIWSWGQTPGGAKGVWLTNACSGSLFRKMSSHLPHRIVELTLRKSAPRNQATTTQNTSCLGSGQSLISLFFFVFLHVFQRFNRVSFTFFRPFVTVSFVMVLRFLGW